MWTPSQKVDLIREVKDRVSLWDTSSPLHSKKNVTDKDWEDVATVMQAEVNTVRAEWRKLRIYYQKLRNENKTHSGDGADINKPSWQFYDEMAFLVPSLTTRTSKSNMIAENELLDQSINVPDENELTFTDEEVRTASLSDATRVPEMNKNAYQNRKTKEMRRKRKPEEEEAQSTMEMMNAVTRALNSKKTAVTVDDHFCSQIANHLREIPDGLEKEELKQKVMNDIVKFRYNT